MMLPVAIACAIQGVSASAQEEVAEEQGAIEEIVVTVNRKEQKIQDVAGAVQAFDQQALDAMGVGADFTALQNVIPGAVISNQEGNVNVSIRGVGSADNTELIDASVANLLNGVYLPRARGIGAMFYDISRVEVNKGPQGTTRGRNAVGGTMNIVANRPNMDGFYTSALLEAGGDALQRYELMANMPLTDTLAVRAAGFMRKQDSQYENAGQPGLEPAGAIDEQSLRLSALWEPSDALSVYAVYDSTSEGGTGYPGLNYFPALDNGYDVSDLGDDAQTGIFRAWQGEVDSSHDGFMVQVQYDFGGVTAEYMGSSREVDFRQTNAANDGVFYPGVELGSFDNFGGLWWITQSESQTHELRLSSSGDTFEWAAGVFFFDEDQQSLLLSTADNSFCCYSATEYAMPDVQGESLAFYAEATYHLNDESRLTAGIRSTDEEKSRWGVAGNYGFAAPLQPDWSTGTQSLRWATQGFQYDPFNGNRGDYTVPDISDVNDVAAFMSAAVERWGDSDNLDDVFAQCLGEDTSACPAASLSLNGTTLTQQDGYYEDSFVDYRLGYEWDLNDSSLVYGNISTGHKSGGFNDTIIVQGEMLSNAFSPEKLVMYEVGAKNEFENITFNASAFYYDYTDYVMTQLVAVGPVVDDQPPPTSAQRRNVGEASITGLELSSTWHINDNWHIGGNLLFLDAELTKAEISDYRQGWGANPNVDISGNKMPFSSDVNLNMFVSGVFPVQNGQYDFTLSSSSRSDYYLSAFNSQGFDSEGNPTSLDMTPINGSVGSGDGYFDEVEGYTLFNLVAARHFDEPNVRVEGFINNITNEIVSTKAIMSPNLNLRFMTNQRTAGIRIKYNM
ncbi:hypothetical protein Mag101_03605 [Microbulbifer agarilyticus]|uniref:TonB-dependent receptor n=1 Tax=Microbulbifer agarilyticus TaxID=260552 RepID=A0A1Q2M3K7_9GAMM|nr:TonB-dependent receptor [Microbulbifer agarilyticus]AQQ66827.1 hypothetical protein Mag101_03605 [Microbulbifer agarilyticus]